ncbi:MAG: glycosyltransferase family 1 protein [Acidimicrobiia bacterium]
MRLWIDGQIFERQGHGGVSRVWLTYLPALAERGLEIQVTVSKRTASSAFRDLARRDLFETRWTDHRVRPISVYDAQWLRTRRLRSLAPDISGGVFQSTWDSTPGLAGWAEVMMVHDMIPELTLRPGRNLFDAQVIRARRRAIANATVLVAVSETTARDLRSTYPEAAKKVRMVPHWPSLDSVAPAALDPLLARFPSSFTPDDFYLFVGRRDGYKNFGVLRRALDESPALARHGVIAVGGPPPSTEEQHPAISFIPHVTDAELVALYRSARALVYPSRYEGFGLPLLEALSNGCRVVAARTDALLEVGGDAAVYFDPASPDQLISALEQVSERDEHEERERARGNLARYSLHRSADQLAEIYRSLAPTQVS